MKNEKIIKGNKLIAEFMDEKLDPSKIISDKTKGKNLWVELVNKELGDNTPPYNLSWEWLMPVVEKIEKMCYKVDIMGSYNFGRRCSIHINGAGKGDFSFTYRSENPHRTKILLLWDSVIEFIKWYNEQNKKQI